MDPIGYPTRAVAHKQAEEIIPDKDLNSSIGAKVRKFRGILAAGDSHVLVAIATVHRIFNLGEGLLQD